MSCAFSTLYALEVGLRLLGLRCRFFCGRCWQWNWFDFALLCCSVLETYRALNDHADFGDGMNLRILRGFRMVRVLRIIRVVRLFPELRLMVCSILLSLSSLAWALVLLIMLMCWFSILLLHGVTHYLRYGNDTQVVNELQYWYGSDMDTMFTLLLAISGGVDWNELVVPLNAISPFYKVVFSFYVVFVWIGVLNVLTSVFVERAREASSLDRDLVIQAEMRQNAAFIREMREIFENADADGTGSISWSKFKEYMQHEQVQAYFATQELDTSEAHELFRLLAAGDSNTVDIEEFVMGCMRLKGQAKSADVAILLRATKLSHRKLRAFMRRAEVHLRLISSGMTADAPSTFLQDGTPLATDAESASVWSG